MFNIMEYNYNNITYNNVKEYGLKISSGPILVNGLTGTDPDDGTGIINAIDIDWNGANLEPLITNVEVKNKLSNLTINTTSDLLNLVAELINLINIKEVPTDSFWYSVGPSEITEDNYIIANNAQEVNEYPEEFNYASDSRQYIYVLLKSDKMPQFIDTGLNANIDVTEITDVNIPGYRVFKSAVKINGLIIIKILNYDKNKIQNVKYWYSVGPTEITEDNFTVVNNVQEVVQYPTEFNYISEERQYIYALVKSDKMPQFIDTGLNAPIDVIELTDVNIPGYRVFKSAVKIIDNIIVKIVNYVEPEYNPEPEPGYELYLYSIGRDEINEANYTYVNNPTQLTYLNEYNFEYTSDVRSYLYILVKNDKFVTCTDATFNLNINITEINNISDYKVYKTTNKILGKINIKIS